MCGALRGVVSEGSWPGRCVASRGAGAHSGESWSAGPSMPPARHCTKQTRPQREGTWSSSPESPHALQAAVCVCVRVCATYDCEIHQRAVQDHAWLVSAAGGASPSPRADGLGFPPPSPAPTPQASGPREGDKLGLVGKVFFLSFCLSGFFFFLLFKNRVVFKWSAPCPRLRRAAGGSAGRVASNLWYCMFWAGKRGRRSSAGSLESNVEVSRSPSGWLCVASRPQFSPLVYFFVRFFFAPPSLLRRGRIHPACLARACCPPRRPAPLTACGGWIGGAGPGLYVTV